MSEALSQNDNSLPLSLELRIDAICQTFEAAWKNAGQGGTPPRIEDLLDAVAEPERPVLLRELLKVELHYRRGERLTLDEYRRRFPEQEALLGNLFDKATLSADVLRNPADAGETARFTPAQKTGQDPLRTTPHEPEQEPRRRTSPAGDTALPAIPGYEILGVLGRGGMGVVYKARQVRLKRIVALKMILAGAHAAPEALARFRVEAEAVARLQHPHLVQIYEVGEHHGLPYCALEFVDGGSLHHKLSGTPQEPRAAVLLVETLAGAIHAAHQRGVIHRDLKPANVLLTAEGVPKVTDFGLAKLLHEDSGQTQTGQIMGTPSYMAPEQATGETGQVGPRTDVYALGVILYEMLTGGLPFKGVNIRDTLDQVCNQDPVPVRQLQPKVPRDLETICLKCLQKDPERRYASAQALAADLERWRNGLPIEAHPLGWLERLGRLVSQDRDVADFQRLGGLLWVHAASVLVTKFLAFLLLWFSGPEPLIWLSIFGSYIPLFTILALRGSSWRPGSPARQHLWSIWVGHCLACLAIFIASREGNEDYITELLRGFPACAALNGLVFIVLGSLYLGRQYALGLAWMGAAILMPLAPYWAPMVYGVLMALCTLWTGYRLRQVAREATAPERFHHSRPTEATAALEGNLPGDRTRDP